MSNKFIRGQLIEYRYWDKWGYYGIVLGITEKGIIRIYGDDGKEDSRSKELVKPVKCVDDIPDLPFSEGYRSAQRSSFKDLARIIEELQKKLEQKENQEKS